jgi:TRAP-type C4-dicarboxylate transport system permease small subunit
MRTLLARLHQAAAILAGILLVLVAVLTLIQITARTIGLPAHSWDEIATFCMAGSTFMGLAYAWRTGAHIRMELIVDRLQGYAKRVVETLALIVMLFAVVYMTWHTAEMTILSWQMNDVSQGLLPIPLWMPQSAMALGSAVLTLALAETLFDTVLASNAGVLSSPSEDVLARASREI